MKNLDKFNFEELFVLDLANNHQGSLAHGLKIIDACADIVTQKKIKAAIKFQFRNLPEFIHHTERQENKNKHTSRFLSTMLDWADFRKLRDRVKEKGMLAVCTPFDEFSVGKIAEMNFDIIKVASCSAKDWPLLESVAESGLPIIASTGGLLQKDVDNLVSFFRHRACDFALMHCVSVYPTPDEMCHLANIADFKQRYPELNIGWSTHENPNEILHVGLALALGATMFERHVGMEAEDIKLNAYSSSPDQLEAWINSYIKSRTILGSKKRIPPSALEVEALEGLSRGVYAKKDLLDGEILTTENIYFAFPCHNNQLKAGEWRPGQKLNGSAAKDAVIEKHTVDTANEDHLILKEAIHEVKAMLAYAKVPLSVNFTTEYSHHYGIKNFRKCGVVLINVINRAYAKKILVQLPNQAHPLHYHKLKEETFIVVWGKLISELDGVERVLYPGDTLTVPPGVWHKFSTEQEGCVFEEISTTAYSNDSVYRDPKINNLTAAQRKTSVDHWGRFQLDMQLRG